MPRAAVPPGAAGAPMVDAVRIPRATISPTRTGVLPPPRPPPARHGPLYSGPAPRDVRSPGRQPGRPAAALGAGGASNPGASYRRPPRPYQGYYQGGAAAEGGRGSYAQSWGAPARYAQRRSSSPAAAEPAEAVRGAGGARGSVAAGAASSRGAGRGAYGSGYHQYGSRQYGSGSNGYGYGHGHGSYNGGGGLYYGPNGPASPATQARALHVARQQWTAAARLRLHAAKGSGGSASAAPGALAAGCLVEFERNDKGVLGLVAGPDGKKNWFVVDTTGRRSSIAPKQVSLLLPGSGYTDSDVASFAAAAEGADLSLLEIAWEIALESDGPLELSELASLLYDDTSPRSLYVTYRMLQRDGLYFKQTGKSSTTAPTFSPRRAEDVAQLRRQAEEAEAARQAAEGWRQAVAAARNARTRAQQPSGEAWATGPFAHRIAAIRAVAVCNPAASSGPAVDEPTLKLALESMQLAGAGSRADPDAAAGFLTELGVLRRHEPLALLRRGVALGADAEEERQAAALLAAPPPDPDANSRLDLTALPVFTIDDATTTEVDDGLSVERLPGGRGVRLWVHVADPTRWIQPGSSLDLNGRRRSRTLYLPWGSVPMFPRALAEGPFSLRAGEVCDALSVGVELLPDGSLQRPTVAPSRVRVSHKLTYEAADAALAEAEAAEAWRAAEGAAAGAEEPVGGLEAAVAADLLELRRAALKRRAYRESRGCIEIPLPEAKIHVPYSHLDRARPGVTISRISQWESASRSLVAEMMILAGEAVGTIGSEASLPLPYRSQDTPDLPPAHLLAAIPEGPCRGFALKRCMTRSSVASAPSPHASLALDAYVQFTSPIRRYSDFMAHANLKAWLRGEAPPFSGSTINAVSEAAAEAGRELGAAERESENYWAAEYMRLNSEAELPATFLGWQREELRLAAFLLENQGLEAVVRLPPGTAGEALAPGDRAVLGVSEANPAAGFFRLFVAGWTSGGAAKGDEEAEEEGEEVEVVGEGAGGGEVVEVVQG
ncbi:hypothetical protein HYH03_016954 [Edaphochlamys debaryana]|uniref:RNB domain-containing protein n=1 Tax=Edaphochlamys debaryana TaxID=47281 RepID=A0A835XQC5_9CHLO|nr:hypothetical protein HYH03_016954 [Edaphochlamys debaryana]|eukprot:KAG2484219.1 hypothetical protein HYH03_016954 [Edaphochlamys debaryana]